MITRDSTGKVKRLKNNQDVQIVSCSFKGEPKNEWMKGKAEKITGKEADIAIIITNLCRKQLLDPFLDLIKRNDADDKLKMVSVFGNVHFQGAYPYTKDMILSDAIKAGGGPKNGTYEAEVELSSRNIFYIFPKIIICIISV